MAVKLIILILTVCYYLAKADVANFDKAQVIDKHNYGFLIRRIQEIYVVTGQAEILFHYTLPDQINQTINDLLPCDRYRVPMRIQRCRDIAPLMRSLHQMRAKNQRHLQDVINRIYDGLDDVSKSPMVKRGLWASAWSAITGLATETDLNKVRTVLRKVEQGIKHAADVWANSAASFTAMVSAEKRRTDNIEKLLEIHKQSLLDMQSNLISRLSRQRDRAEIIEHIISDFIAPAILETAEIDSLYDSIQSLISGLLPHRLINHTTLRTALTYLDNHLKESNSGLEIAVKDLGFYYHTHDFSVFRHGPHVLIKLNVPITIAHLENPLHFSRIEKIPLLTPLNDSYYTELAVDFNYLAFSVKSRYVVTAKQYPIFKFDSILDLTLSQVNLKRATPDLCETALIYGDLNTIQIQCRYHISYGTLPPQIFRLRDDLFLFSNVSELQIDCTNSLKNITPTVNKITATQIQFCLQ